MTALRNKAGDSGEAEELVEVEPGEGPWSHEGVLLAEIKDAVNQVIWAVLQTNSEKSIPRPEPTPRPGVKRSDSKKKQAPDPLLMEWLRRRQNGEDTSDLGLSFENVVPFQPLERPKTE